MKSSKWMIGLVAVVLVLTLAPSSFAQVQLQLFNTPSSGEIQTNRHANSADPLSPGAGLLISGQLLANSSLTTTDFVLQFPATITSGSQAVLTTPNFQEAIRIEGAIGLFATAAISTINYSLGTVTLTLPGFPPPAGNTQSGSFRLVGVRLDVAGKTAPLALTSAALVSNANNYISPSSLPTLISALGPGLNATSGLALGNGPGGANLGTATIFTTGVVIDNGASVVLAEGFASAWRTATQTATSGFAQNMNGTNIRLTIAGLPAGVTATVSLPVPAAGIPAVSLSVAALTSTTTQTTLSFTGAAGPDLTIVETIPLAFVFTSTATSLTAGTTITLVATIAPVNGAASLQTTGSGYPRFTGADTPAVTIANIGAAKTTMLVPYAVRVGAYDTGMAIANTTKDPFTTGGATASDGPISFYLYPRTSTGAGTAASFTTDATKRPGDGLDSTGKVVAGGLWSGLLSQLVAQTTLPADFIGYVFIEANFLDAHGVAYLLTGSNISSGLPIMTLNQPSVVARSTTLESLGF